jgi:DNA-binding transcriptional MerR regulator
MTIGEFSKRSRLSAKALRLFDELGLWAHAEVEHGARKELAGYLLLD